MLWTTSQALETNSCEVSRERRHSFIGLRKEPLKETGKWEIVKQSLTPVQGIILLSLTFIAFFSKVLRRVLGSLMTTLERFPNFILCKALLHLLSHSALLRTHDLKMAISILFYFFSAFKNFIFF